MIFKKQIFTIFSLVWLLSACTAQNNLPSQSVDNAANCPTESSPLPIIATSSKEGENFYERFDYHICSIVADASTVTFQTYKYDFVFCRGNNIWTVKPGTWLTEFQSQANAAEYHKELENPPYKTINFNGKLYQYRVLLNPNPSSIDEQRTEPQNVVFELIEPDSNQPQRQTLYTLEELRQAQVGNDLGVPRITAALNYENRLFFSVASEQGEGFNGIATIVSYDPQKNEPTVQTRAKNLLKHGLDKLNQGNYPGAIEDFKQAVRLDPNFIEAYICQSIIHYYQGDHLTAIEDCNQVLRINSRHADAYNNRGLNRVALEDYKKAIADFDQALEIEPNHAKAYLNRGYSRLQLNDNWGAIEDFDRALYIDPQAAKVYLTEVINTLNAEPKAINNDCQPLAKGLLIEGNLRYESGDYQKAIETYTQVLRLEPNNSEAYNRRSTARPALGDYEGAYEDLYKATVYYLNEEQSFQIPQSFVVQSTAEDYHQQGVEKLQRGDFQRAIEDFNQVLQIDAKNAHSLTCRGFAQQRLGDTQRAIEDLQQAAKLFSEQGDVKSSHHILETLKKLQP